MKSTGIVRKVDELGRIVLPIELRRTYDLAVRDSIEIYTEDDKIILKSTRKAVFSAETRRTSSILRIERSALTAQPRSRVQSNFTDRIVTIQFMHTVSPKEHK